MAEESNPEGAAVRDQPSQPNLSLAVPLGEKAAPALRAETGRSKVELKPGHSLMDWIQLSTGKCLASKRMDFVKDSELSKHNKVKDCWTLIEGRVYDVTNYLEFHPGGVEELMRAAGRDGTYLFRKYHRWISHENMLKSCFVGMFEGDRNALAIVPPLRREEKKDKLAESDDNVSTTLAEAGIRVAESEHLRITVSCDKWGNVKKENVSADAVGVRFRVRVQPFMEDPMALVWVGVPPVAHIRNISVSDKKITLSLGGASSLQLFTSPNLSTFTRPSDLEYRRCTLLDAKTIARNTHLYVLRYPASTFFDLPIGHHVYLRIKKGGSFLIRPYTPVLVNTEERTVSFVIKLYDNGLFTSALALLSIGHKIDMSDSIGRVDLFGKSAENVLMLAAGTGITPMLRFLAARRNQDVLLLFNRTAEYVLPEKLFHYCILASARNFKLVNYFSARGDGERLTGRISTDVLAEHVPSFLGQGGYFIHVCGPSPFVDAALSALAVLKIDRSNIYVFGNVGDDDLPQATPP